MSLTLIKSAARFALLAVLAAGCGTAAAAQHTPAKPAAAAQHTPARPTAAAPDHQHRAPVHAQVTTPPAAPATSAPAQAANPIPQGNAGDQDADNNGGPSDGDGNI